MGSLLFCFRFCCFRKRSKTSGSAHRHAISAFPLCRQVIVYSWMWEKSSFLILPNCSVVSLLNVSAVTRAKSLADIELIWSRSSNCRLERVSTAFLTRVRWFVVDLGGRGGFGFRIDTVRRILASPGNGRSSVWTFVGEDGWGGLFVGVIQNPGKSGSETLVEVWRIKSKALSGDKATSDDVTGFSFMADTAGVTR